MIGASNANKLISNAGTKTIKLIRGGVVVGNVSVVIVGAAEIINDGIIQKTRRVYIGIPNAKVSVDVGDMVGTYGIVSAVSAMVDGTGKVICYKADIDE